MTECLHLTDEEALDRLLRCIAHIGDDEVPTLVVAVVGSHLQTQWLVENVLHTTPEAVYSKSQRMLHFKNTRVRFVRSDESLDRLSAIQPYTWLPLCDNIPAKLISWMIYRTRVGEAKYWDQVRKGEKDGTRARLN